MPTARAYRSEFPEQCNQVHTSWGQGAASLRGRAHRKGGVCFATFALFCTTCSLSRTTQSQAYRPLCFAAWFALFLLFAVTLTLESHAFLPLHLPLSVCAAGSTPKLADTSAAPRGKVLHAKLLNENGNDNENERGNMYPFTMSVRDTGIGISPEHLRNLFRPFEQVGVHPSHLLASLEPQACFVCVYLCTSFMRGCPNTQQKLLICGVIPHLTILLLWCPYCIARFRFHECMHVRIILYNT